MNINYVRARVRSVVSVEYRSMIFAEALAQSLEAGISVYDSMCLLEDCMLPWILIPTLAKTVEHSGQAERSRNRFNSHSSKL